MKLMKLLLLRKMNRLNRIQMNKKFIPKIILMEKLPTFINQEFKLKRLRKILLKIFLRIRTFINKNQKSLRIKKLNLIHNKIKMHKIS